MRKSILALLVCVVSWSPVAQAERGNGGAETGAAPVAPGAAAADVDHAIETLRRAIGELRSEVAALREENAQLRRQLAEVRRAAQAPSGVNGGAGGPAMAAAGTAGGSGNRVEAAATPTTQGASDPGNQIARGMTLREARAVLGEPSAQSNSGGGTRRVTWKGYRQGSVYRVISADVDANGLIQDFTEARD